MKSIIEEIRTQEGNETLEARRLIYPVEGGAPPKIQLHVRYKNRETGELYRCLGGGLSWPGAHPGYVVVLTVLDFGEGEEPKYKVIDEFEEKHLPTFLNKCYEIHQKYGKSCRMIPYRWYGNAESSVNDFAFRHNQ